MSFWVVVVSKVFRWCKGGLEVFGWCNSGFEGFGWFWRFLGGVVVVFG